MKTALLKKLRTEAYKMYGIKSFIELGGGGGVYIVGNRELTSKNDVAEYTLKAARRRLGDMRKEYCKNRVQELRNKYDRENKYRRL